MDEEAGAPRSAGLLVHRRVHPGKGAALEVLIGHMGGPFWSRREERAYSIPKGGIEPGETSLQAALREFQEETGLAAPPPPYRDLGHVRQRSGKIVHAHDVHAEDFQIDGFQPAMVEITRRGTVLSVPELDRIVWVPLQDAARLLITGQAAFLDRLL